jgi:hypothetical protein
MLRRAHWGIAAVALLAGFSRLARARCSRLVPTGSARRGFVAQVEASLLDATSGIWTAPMAISGPGGNFPDVAFDGSGDAVAVWMNYANGHIEYANYAEGGVPPPPGPPPGPRRRRLLSHHFLRLRRRCLRPRRPLHPGPAGFHGSSARSSRQLGRRSDGHGALLGAFVGHGREGRRAGCWGRRHAQAGA